MRAYLVRRLRALWPEWVALLISFCIFGWIRQQVPVWADWQIPLPAAPTMGPRLLEGGEALYYGIPARTEGLSLWDQNLRFFDRRSGRGLMTRGTGDIVNPANVRHGPDGCAYFWKVHEEPPGCSFVRLNPKDQSEVSVFGPTDRVAMPLFTPDNSSLMMLHSRGDGDDWQSLATLIDLKTGQSLWTQPCSYFPRFSRDGRLIWLGHEDRDWIHYTIHDRHSGSFLARVPRVGDLPIRGQRLLTSDLVLLPDGLRIVITGRNPVPLLEVWNVETGKRERALADFTEHGSEAHSLSMDGDLLAIQQGFTVKVFSVTTGQLLYERTGLLADAVVRRNELRTSTFLKDDAWLVLLDSASAKPSLSIYAARTGILKVRLPVNDARFAMTSLYSLGPSRLVVEGTVTHSPLLPFVEWLQRFNLAPKDIRQQLVEYRVYDLATGEMLLAFPKVIQQRDLTGNYLARGELSPTGDIALLLEQCEGAFRINQVPLGGGSRSVLLSSYSLSVEMTERWSWVLALAALIVSETLLRGGVWLAKRVRATREV